MLITQPTFRLLVVVPSTHRALTTGKTPFFGHPSACRRPAKTKHLVLTYLRRQEHKNPIIRSLVLAGQLVK
jgi:hypothetical protein